MMMDDHAMDAARDPSPLEVTHAVLTLMAACHRPARRNGWWTDPATGAGHLDSDERFGLRIALMHSELSEALEGRRKNSEDDHLPGLRNDVVELGDALIRICDMAGGLDMRLPEAVAQKLQYNAVRADHKREARLAPGGKAF